MEGKKNSKNLTLKLTATLCLSLMMFSCSSFAEEPDFSAYDFFAPTNSNEIEVPLESEEVAQPIQKNDVIAKNIKLDTTQISKPVQPHTTNPLSLRSFSEEEYFSSDIDVTPPPEQPSLPKDLPDVGNTDTEEPEMHTVKFERETVDENSFFKPLMRNHKDAESGTQSPQAAGTEVYVPDTEINAAVNADVTSYNSVDPDGDVNLEGHTIKSVEINGLKTVKPEIIREQLSTQIGSKFNSNILQQDLQKIYATGYFTDIMSIEPTMRYDGDVDLVFNLQENILVSNVTFSGNSVINAVELEPFVVELKNLPQNLNKINDSIDKINDYYHSKGYILACVETVDDNAKGELNFVLNEGKINSIKFSGNTKTKEYVIARNIITQPGTVYNDDYLKKDLAKVYATQIFEDVDRELTPSPANDGTYDVTVVVKEKSTNSLALGGGLDTALGIFGSVTAKEDNWGGRGQKLSLTGIIGSGILMSDASIQNRMNWQVELNFFEPYLLNPETSLAGRLYYKELGSYQVPLAIERRIGVGTTIMHKVKGNDNLSTSLGLGVEHINLKEGNFGEISKLYAQNHLNIADRARQLSGGLFLNVAPGVKYSKLDNELLPREGVVAQARFMESFGLGSLDKTNGRLLGTITKYIPVFKKSTLALSAKAGLKVHGKEMPEIMAFGLGGPYTIRGFRMNGVGTGDSFLMGSAELDTPIPFFDRIKYDVFKNMRFAFFMDAGSIFQPTISSTLYDRPLRAISMGVGLRINIPNIGPISIDYGLPLTNPGHYGSSNGYFTFGTGGYDGF